MTDSFSKQALSNKEFSNREFSNKEYSKQNIIDQLTIPITEVSKCYPTARSAIMPALYLVQEEYGFLDETAYRAIAEILEVPEIWVFELASFYTLYKHKGMGKYHIQLCTNVPCMLRGAYELLAHLQTRLGINLDKQKRKGNSTIDKDNTICKDGLFTLSTVECIGSCDVAPAMMVNETYHCQLSKQLIDQLLDELTQAETDSLAIDIKTLITTQDPLSGQEP